MEITRRQAIVNAVVVPLAASAALGAFSGMEAAAQPEGQTGPQFTDPPLPPTDEELALLGLAVAAGRASGASGLVRDARFASLHPQPVFRELVKAVARESVLTIPGDDEPGARIVAAGAIVDGAGQAVKGAVVYAYHTSAKGWYSDKAAHIRAWAGDARHARLFGYLRPGGDGVFEIRTIRPGGYPRSTLPQHIHLEVWADGFEPRVTELLFDDDPRLTAEQRMRAEREGFIVAAGAAGSDGKPTFRYRVELKKA